MLSKFVFGSIAVTLAGAALLLPQGGRVSRQDFTDCDLDIRPDNRPEVDVYWHEAPQGQSGYLMVFHARTDNVLQLGFPDGDPNKEIYLKEGDGNTALFLYDESAKTITLETFNGTDKQSHVIATGVVWKPLYDIEPPTETMVRKPGPNLERIMLTGKNFDLEFQCTVTRSIP